MKFEAEQKEVRDKIFWVVSVWVTGEKREEQGEGLGMADWASFPGTDQGSGSVAK